MYRPNRLSTRISLLSALLLLGASVSHAQSAFSVSMDTSFLIGHPSAPFSLDFQFTDGSGTNDGNNTVSLSNFNFGAGSATGVPTISGGASGDLLTGITLTDSSFFNELFQGFIPGNTLSFDVFMTGNADVGETPDQFSFAVLDSSLSEIPTTGFGAFLTADINPFGVTIQTFPGTDQYSAMPRPTVTSGAAAPEPGSIALLLSGGLLGLSVLRRRRK